MVPAPLPMLASALELVLKWTVPAIQEYCRSLTSEVTQTLRERGYWVEDDNWRGAHLFGVRPDQAGNPAVLAERLHARHVSVSLRGDAIRVSPNLYNDAGDVEALLDVLAD